MEVKMKVLKTRKIKNSFFVFTAVTAVLMVSAITATGCKIEQQNTNTFTAAKGDIITTITATGTVDSTESKNFTLMQSAKVLQSLKKGDTFKKGDILIKIDDSKAKLYLSQAEQNILLAEQSMDVANINYHNALDANHVAVQIAQSSNDLAQKQTDYAFKALDNAASAGIASINAANQSIENANYYLEVAKDSALSTDLIKAQAKTNVSSAEKALEQTQKTVKSQEDSAEGAYEQALSNQSITYWNNVSSLEMAASQIALMKKSISQAQTQLDISKINLDLAKLDLDNFVVTAPFDGIVTEASFSDGETGSPGVPAISIISNDFIIKSDINETDISKIKPGQEADFTLDAYPDMTFHSTVSDISPVSKDIAGIVTFEITLKPDGEAPDYLRYGFSSNLTVMLSKTENVLYVPIQAVYEENGKNYVDLLGKDNEKIKTEITTGNSDYDNIEVKSGLSEGDIIVVSG
jgi:HlyD family secretion protein